jgi:hypothetical protein
MGRSHPFLLQRCGVSPLETAEVSPEASEVKWKHLKQSRKSGWWFGTYFSFPYIGNK